MNKIFLSSVVIALLSFSGCGSDTTTTPTQQQIDDISFSDATPTLTRVDGQALSAYWTKASSDIEFFVSGGVDKELFVVTNTATQSTLNYKEGKEPVYIENGDNEYVVEIRGKDVIEDRLGAPAVFTIIITANTSTPVVDTTAPILTTPQSFSMDAGSSRVITANESVTFLDLNDSNATGFVLESNGRLTAPTLLNVYIVPILARDTAGNSVRKDFNISVVADSVNPTVSATATAAIDSVIILATDDRAVTAITLSGADAAAFTVSGTTVTTPATAGEYTVTVEATDAAGNTTTQDVVVTVTDVVAGDPTVRTATTPYIGSDVVELGGKKWLKLKGTSDGSDDIINSDGTMSLYSYRKTWDEAATICGALTLDGATAGDWSVPTRAEAQTLIVGFTEEAPDVNGGIAFTGSLNTAVLGTGSDANTSGFWTSDEAQAAVGFYNMFYNSAVNQPFSLTCVK